MSAIGGKADIGRTCSDVRLGQAQGSQAAHVLDHGGEARVGVEQLMAIKRIGWRRCSGPQRRNQERYLP